jgi:uncharacterized protein YegP (UPF0339 family)
MAGQFEILGSQQGGYSFRLIDSSGNLLVTSGPFPTKQAAAAGIVTVREIAGTGLIRDMSSRGLSGQATDKQAAAIGKGSIRSAAAAGHSPGPPAHRHERAQA